MLKKCNSLDPGINKPRKAPRRAIGRYTRENLMILFIESFGFGISGIPLMTDRSINDRRKCLACERNAPRSRGMTRHSFSSRQFADCPCDTFSLCLYRFFDLDLEHAVLRRFYFARHRGIAKRVTMLTLLTVERQIESKLVPKSLPVKRAHLRKSGLYESSKDVTRPD